MKASLKYLLVLSFPLILSAQSFNIQNSANYLRSKEYDKAKAAADAAVIHESTANNAKAWMYRGRIYAAIIPLKDEKYKNLDPEAAEKAVESFVKCFQLDKDKVYFEDSDVKNDFVFTCSNLMFYKAVYYRSNKEYEKALKCYDIMQSALQYELKEGSLKRNNITKESIMFERFKTAVLAGDYGKSKEFANQLIDVKYKDPNIYTNISNMAIQNKDTAAALSYLEKGLLLFDDNMDILNAQINILFAQKKINELKQKLEAAVEANPDNEAYHAVLGNVYDKTGEKEKAEKEYSKAIELNPKNEAVLFNLGAYYFNAGNEWNKKYNDLPPNETKKAKEYEGKANEDYKKAIDYFEQYYALRPSDKAVKQRLRQLHLRFGETEKADKYK